jgi:hypothetical protein
MSEINVTYMVTDNRDSNCILTTNIKELKLGCNDEAAADSRPVFHRDLTIFPANPRCGQKRQNYPCHFHSA